MVKKIYQFHIKYAKLASTHDLINYSKAISFSELRLYGSQKKLTNAKITEQASSNKLYNYETWAITPISKTNKLLK